VRPEPEEVRLLSQWRGLHALYKPPGLSSEPDRRGEASLAREAARLLAVPPADVHVATRLDAPVSGIVVVAVGREATKLVTELQRTHALERRYLALADGMPAPPSGIWDVPIPVRGVGRGGAPVASGNAARAARTRYAVVESFSGTRAAGTTSFVVAEPETGRTHQIRIHAANAGAPLLGDGAHGGIRQVVLSNGSILPLPRVLLHATRVRAVLDGKVAWHVDEPLPGDFRAICEQLGIDAHRIEAATSAMPLP
jgi:23S rRNA pseudouridine1911/1915/1917 synthase